MSIKDFKNPWGENGKYWKDNALQNNVLESDSSFIGGEVTNESDTAWLVSGASNSDYRHFIWLPPNTNSDKYDPIIKKLDSDVDAIWPAGKPIKNSSTGEIVTSGAFKLRDHRNTNIDGSATTGYIISDFSVYYKNDELPPNWKLPKEYEK